MASISFIIPSINRETLHKTIQSMDVWPGDEVLVEFDIPPSGGWGNEQRNSAIVRAKGDYLSFMDDDDCYVPGARKIMHETIKQNPGKPILFKVEYPDGNIIWKEKKIVPGNISTQMILIPNKRDMFSPWRYGRNMADFIFVDTWKWEDGDIFWSEEIISLQGHNDIIKL